VSSGDRLVRVVLPHAVYGLVVAGGRVVMAPPIAAWMVGRDEREVARWLARKGARWELVGAPAHGARAAVVKHVPGDVGGGGVEG
jgi:hypothetical protein